MKIRTIQETLRAEVLWGEHLLELDIDVACGADLMSDVLACEIGPKTLLITSLTNPQVMRTAEMVDMTAILFVRGRRPSQTVINMAQHVNVPLLYTSLNMFEVCGLLYQTGLKGCW